MKFVALFLALFLFQVLVSQDVGDSHEVAVGDLVTLPPEVIPNSQSPSPVKPEKLLPWPLNSLLPRSLRRISFRKLTVYILKQPIRLIRYLCYKITGKGSKEVDSKAVLDNQNQ